MRWLLLCLSIMAPVHAEIEKVIFTWNAVQCDSGCIRNIKNQFNSHVRNARDLELNADLGVGTFRWDSKAPFNFMSIKNAMQMVGLGFRNATLTVTGYVRIDGNTVRLTSTGDRSTFILIGPLETSSTMFVNRGSVVNYPIPNDMMTQFVNADAGQAMVSVTGDIFMPNITPYRLSVTRVSIVKDQNQNQNNQNQYQYQDQSINPANPQSY